MTSFVGHFFGGLLVKSDNFFLGSFGDTRTRDMTSHHIILLLLVGPIDTIFLECARDKRKDVMDALIG
jgi:hypothetical protein